MEDADTSFWVSIFAVRSATLVYSVSCHHNSGMAKGTPNITKICPKNINTVLNDKETAYCIVLTGVGIGIYLRNVGQEWHTKS